MQKFSCLVSACISSKGKQKMQALTSEKKKIQLSPGSEQTAVSLLVFRAFETKISPVLISPTTANQDQASRVVLRHAKKHHLYKILQRNFSPAGFPVPFSLLPSSLPWERALESSSNSIYLPNSSGLTVLLLWIRKVFSSLCQCRTGDSSCYSKSQGSR